MAAKKGFFFFIKYKLTLYKQLTHILLLQTDSQLDKINLYKYRCTVYLSYVYCILYYVYILIFSKKILCFYFLCYKFKNNIEYEINII